MHLLVLKLVIGMAKVSSNRLLYILCLDVGVVFIHLDIKKALMFSHKVDNIFCIISIQLSSLTCK